MIWEMRALSTHLYPGALLLCSTRKQAQMRPGDILRIEFADMSLTLADVTATGEDEALIKVDGYRTRYGTQIDTKMWMVKRTDTVHDSPCYLVTERLTKRIPAEIYP